MPSIRVNRLFPAVVAALALLFAVLDPPASRALSFPAALAFWIAHIGVGMLLAVLATEWLSRRPRVAGWNPWYRLLAGGLAGSLLFAPFALLVDTLLPLSAEGDMADGLLDHWEAGGGPLALLAEWLQLCPSYLASWLLVNAVPLAAAPGLVLPSPPAHGGPHAADPGSGPEAPATLAVRTDTPARMDATMAQAPTTLAADVSHRPPTNDDPVGVGEHTAAAPRSAAPTATAGATTTPASDASLAGFMAELPPAIGTDLISIQADLHYLQVRTTRGRATVLASIAAAEHALAGQGLRVHRSYWVATRHVARLARSARGTFLILSDGSRVPVSRRRIAEVQSRLGRDFVVDPT